MASPGNQHCANCIGALSFPVKKFSAMLSSSLANLQGVAIWLAQLWLSPALDGHVAEVQQSSTGRRHCLQISAINGGTRVDSSHWNSAAMSWVPHYCHSNTTQMPVIAASSYRAPKSVGNKGDFGFSRTSDHRASGCAILAMYDFLLVFYSDFETVAVLYPLTPAKP